MDTSTKLEDLLDLQLYNLLDDVHGVIERAIREVAMDKSLKEMASTWSTLELVKELHSRTGTAILKIPEDLIITLEENQVSSI